MKLRWTPRERCTPEQVNAQKNTVRAGPTWILGATVEAGSGREGDERTIRGLESRPGALTTQEEARAGPSPPRRRQGSRGDPLGPPADPARLLSCTLLVGNCAKPLKKRLDLGPARLGRHFLSFPEQQRDRQVPPRAIRGCQGGSAGGPERRPGPPRGGATWPTRTNGRAAGGAGAVTSGPELHARAPVLAAPCRGQSTGGAGRQLAHRPKPRRLRAPRRPRGGRSHLPEVCEGCEAGSSASVRASSQCVMINSPYQTLRCRWPEWAHSTGWAPAPAQELSS